MSTSSIEIHLNEIPIKRLYKIQEKVLHELSVHHLGLYEEYQDLGLQHTDLNKYWDQVQIEKASIEPSKQSITTSVHEIYNQIPKKEANQEIIEPQDPLQQIAQAVDLLQIQLTELQLKNQHGSKEHDSTTLKQHIKQAQEKLTHL